MSSSWEIFLERVVKYWPKLIESLGQTGIMMAFAAVAAILIGLPLGTWLFLAGQGKPLENKWVHGLLNTLINIIRSFPFLLLVVVMQPFIRAVYGRATGDPIAASFPMMVIASALYARFVEQSLMDLPPGVVESAEAMGANPFQMVTKFLFIEAGSSLIVGFTTAFVSFLSYSTIMGAIGGGGIGDFAIRYGYQRYERDIMYLAILIIIMLVQIFQWFGFKLARSFNKK